MGATGAKLDQSRLADEVEWEWTQLTFHYGLTFEEIARMPRWARRLYLRALPRLRAEDQLSQIEAVSFPHMKPESRRSTVRRLELRVNSGVLPSAPAPKTAEEQRQALEALGISVQEVNAGA